MNSGKLRLLMGESQLPFYGHSIQLLFCAGSEEATGAQPGLVPAVPLGYDSLLAYLDHLHILPGSWQRQAALWALSALNTHWESVTITNLSKPFTHIDFQINPHNCIVSHWDTHTHSCGRRIGSVAKAEAQRTQLCREKTQNNVIFPNIRVRNRVIMHSVCFSPLKTMRLYFASPY